jgi:hypothetical protein
MTKGPYTRGNRLADVLALIQVLAVADNAHRTEEGLAEALQIPKPHSGPSWCAVAAEHPEFFRVQEGYASLTARHVLWIQDVRTTVQLEFIAALFQSAIRIHDGQVEAAGWWKNLIPLWAAIVGGLLGTVSTLITLWLSGSGPRPH